MGLADVKKLDPTYNTRGGGGYRDQLRDLMGGGDEENPAEEERANEEPEPGSDAYLRRRDRQSNEDLRNAPRR